MKRICGTLLLVAAVGCVPVDSEKKDSDWELTENSANNQSTNNQSTNNRSTNNQSTNNQSTNNQSTNNQSTNNTTVSCLVTPPEVHRPDDYDCDNERGPGVQVDPDHPAVSCLDDAACTDGLNGRCIGNGHDGYYCSYDECLADTECGSVCECEGGFRGDHNVCLPGNCVTDADCGETGYCSPSMGDCGDYSGTVGYFCHTCEDECVNDSDCGNPNSDPFGSYCAFDQGVGHWLCSNSHCAG